MKHFQNLFPNRKPIIAMAHLPPLPGTPMYDENSGISGMIETVKSDLDILLNADFDAVMFCNEGDLPYMLHADFMGIATMTHVISNLAPKDLPFGVDFLWDAQAALAIAAATGASFIREVTTGVYESDMGLWNTNAGALLRERRRIHADHIAIFMNVVPEFASQVGNRKVTEIAHSAAVSSLADAILVSGPMAGVEPELNTIEEAKAGVGDKVPVLSNTGAKSTNISAILDVCDGVIVGSDLKRDGYTWNQVDPERVKKFMKAAGR